MKIVTAVRSDLEEILELQYLAYQSEAALYNHSNIQPLQQKSDELMDEFKQQLFLKAVMNDTIIGSVRAYQVGETCKVGKLIVHPDFQNRGLGTTLMTEIERSFSECSRFELFTGSKSLRNIYLYNKLGYRIYKEDPINDELTLVYLEKFEVGED